MRYLEIINETKEDHDLLVGFSKAIRNTVVSFCEARIEEWTRTANIERREKLGYHRHFNNVADWQREYGYRKPLPDNFKPFDQEEFDDANRDWSATADWIGDRLDTLIPNEGHSPVYAIMGAISKSLTSVLQKHVRNVYGDPVMLQGKSREVPVSNIRVSVWWHAKGDIAAYSGVYRTNSYHANGNETLLEVVVNRDHWRDNLIDSMVSIMSGDNNINDEFSESIINTLMHEAAHLFQDIKGQKNYGFSIIPKDGSRHSNGSSGPENDPEMLQYFARPAEIDSFATGAAAQVIDRIVREKPHLSDIDWNYYVNDAMKMPPPSREWVEYVHTMKEKMADITSPIKAKYFEKVKNRFLKTYYKKLASYLK